MRSGVIAQKVGMTRVYNDAGEHIPVTVSADGKLPGSCPSHGRQEWLHRSSARCRPRLRSRTRRKPLRGQFADRQLWSRRQRSSSSASRPDNLIDVGAELTVKPLRHGPARRRNRYDLIGKGFARCVMKRHNFGGLPCNARRVRITPLRMVRLVPTPGSGQASGRVSAWLAIMGSDTHHHPEPVEVVSTDEDRGLILDQAAPYPAPRAHGSSFATPSRSGTAEADAPKSCRCPRQG